MKVTKERGWWGGRRAIVQTGSAIWSPCRIVRSSEDHLVINFTAPRYDKDSSGMVLKEVTEVISWSTVRRIRELYQCLPSA